MRRRSTPRVWSQAVVALTLGVALSGAAVVPAMPATIQGSVNSGVGVPPCAGPGTTDLAGLAAGAHPVILVHGWIGSPLQPMRKALEDVRGADSGYQFLLFDYQSDARHWADYPQIHECLAKYILAVSDAHRAAHGDGRVFLVGHSMGGLAARFAAGDTIAIDGVGGGVSAGDRIAGLITIDTPDLGSMWGDTGWSANAEQLLGQASTAVPAPESPARVCLAVHDATHPLPTGCSPTPYLPGGVPVAQVVGMATVSRSIGPVHLYDVIVGGDGVVDQASQSGYSGSGPAGDLPAVNEPIQTSYVRCTTDTGALVALVARINGPAAATLVATAVGVDWIGMGSLNNRTPSPYTASLLLTVALTPCGHSGVTSSPETARQVMAQLDAWVAKSEIILSETGVGSVRQSPAGTTVGASTVGAFGEVVRLLGQPDEIRPPSTLQPCTLGARARWGDLELEFRPDEGGALANWAVLGGKLPVRVSLPYDIRPGQPMSDVAAATGLTPVNDSIAGLYVGDVGAMSWLANTSTWDYQSMLPPSTPIGVVTSSLGFCE